MTHIEIHIGVETYAFYVGEGLKGLFPFPSVSAR